MTVDFDSSQEPRSLAQQLALVRAVRDGVITDETDWLEWKCEPALTSAAIAKIAKAILAFANRDPRAAKHHVGGVGLFLLGVEPHNAPGLSDSDARLDRADLHNKIVPLCGGKIQWDADYVDLDEATFLVVTVAPPRPGDPLYPARKDAGGGTGGRKIVTGGAIYVRQGTKSAPASADQIDMLIARQGSGLNAEPEQLQVKVACVDEPRAAIDVSSAALDRATSKAVSRLPSPRRKPKPSQPQRTTSDATKRPGLQVGAPDDVLQQFRASIQSARYSGIGAFEPTDEAAEAQYGDKLVKHEKSVREALPDYLRVAAITRRLAPLTLTLTNPTDGTISGIAITIELDLPADAGSISFDPEDSKPENQPLPKPPLPPSRQHLRGLGVGGGGLGAIFLPRGPIELFLPKISRIGDRVTVQFRDQELRALEADHRLPSLMLAIRDPTIDSIPVRWSATSAHLRGKRSGTLTIPFGGIPVFAEDLIDPIEPFGT